jgi:amino acid adenylation domain-containing protein
MIILPLTDTQKGILFEIERFGKRSYYINQELLVFKTNLNISLFEKALVYLVAKYEILRSSVVFKDSPNLAIYESAEVPFKTYDYSHFDDDKKIAFFNAFLEEDFRKNMDISTPPLMRVTVFKFTKNEYRVVWNIHHLIVDGASTFRIIKDFFEIYSLLLKKQINLPEKTVPYYDGHDTIVVPDPEVSKKYWQKLLSGYETSSSLPCTNKNNVGQSKKNINTIFIKGDSYRRVIDFSKSHSLPINCLLQTSWAIVLSHYSNNEKVIFGSVRAYPRDIIKDNVGLFINTLPMCFSIDFSSTVNDFLNKVREQGKELRNYAVVPLSQIRVWGDLPFEAPIFQSILNYEPFSLNETLAEHFPEIPCEFSSKLDTPYPLILEVIDDGKSLKLDLYYETGLFEDRYMNYFLNHYQDILAQIISNPNEQLAELPVVDKETYNRVVLEWNDTITDYPLNETVHQIFEGEVKKTPNAPALVYEDKVLTYKALNDKANQLAYYLIQHKVAIEDPIVFLLKPRFEAIIAILAILKAGGAYVPIDTNNPSERMRYLLHEIKPKIIITETPYIDILSQLIKHGDFPKPIIIDVNKPSWNNNSLTNPSVAVKASNLMYIIYTSGSTGKPKGAMIEHQAAINMAYDCSKRLKITPKSRLLQLAAFSFDVSVAEWAMTLLSGATLYLLEREVFSPQKIVQALKHHKITTIILSHSILAALPEADLPDLKVIAPGGEPLSKHSLSFWAKNRLFLNVYGITETTVCSTMAVCTPKTKHIAVGKPLGNTQIYILNKQLQPLPPGVIGEIYIGGCGVARGYWNNQQTTQEKFVDNIFMAESLGKKKMYKTGDFGRWLDSGELEFIGRIDDQVKIRGVRVEISEIQNVLEQYLEIDKAVVLVKRLENASQLIAYVLPLGNTTINMGELQKYLNIRLPSSMIPSQIIQIDQLPLNAHGKVDKKKLLSMNEAYITKPLVREDGNGQGLSKIISDIIQKLLQRSDISIQKNFLDMGLDSIMLVDLSAKLTSEFKMSIDVTTLLTYPTIDKLVKYIKNSTKPGGKEASFDSIKEFVRRRKKN